MNSYKNLRTSYILLENMIKNGTESSPNIMQDYLDITKEYQLKYGEKTILLMQVGAFFEAYGLKHPETGVISFSQIEEFSQICQLNVSEKKINFLSQQIVMAGFRDYSLDKYLQKLTDFGYTTVVYVQEKEGKTIKRVLQGVYSAGTYISYETDSSPQITNNIMCIWIDVFTPLNKSSVSKIHNNIIYGVSVINTFTGKSFIFEYQTPFLMNPTTFDELERYISVYEPSEIIFISPFDNVKNNTILQYSGVKSRTIHHINSNDVNNTHVMNCKTQKYIQHILSTFFGDEAYHVCSEFNTHSIATQSLCYLMNFIQEHNFQLVRKVSIPEFNNATDRLVLANHTLKQLNVIDDNTNESKLSGHLSSVLSFLNKCVTAMGRRKFQSQLLNPVFNENWLNAEYSMIATMLLENNNHFIDLFRKQLAHVRDIEKICRQLIIKKIYPSSIYQLYKSIEVIQQLNACLGESPVICHYLCNEIGEHEDAFKIIDDICMKILQFLDKVLNIEKCKTTNSVVSFDDNIIKSGVSNKLDELVKEYTTNINAFDDIKAKLNSIIGIDIDYIKTHETDKSGISLQITKTRGNVLKKIIKGLLENPPHSHNIKFIFGEHERVIDLKDIELINASTSSYEIDIPILQKICKELLFCKEKMNNYISESYLQIIGEVETKFLDDLENLAKFVAKIDVLQSKTYVAKNYHYCSPEIANDGSDKSFVNAIGLRHCLIENLLQNEIYEKNDIFLGTKNTDGIILYGTNAVGKTSIIRALGISIIMAQSGMYVPCSQFIYKPYTSIYSRILGNDNMFKGLSTFAVEMSELRIILKMADKRSLILGDEVCSGTETESALSIFVAALMELHTKKSSFIFATHFHEIIHYDEIQSMARLAIKHMSVLFDKEHDRLIYDRRLKDGPGIRTYGLEVCKSLYLTEEFLENAYRIRNKYNPETRGELTFKTSQYNAKKIVGFCELCKVELAGEVHHLQQQKNADENGFIDSFHKNHIANLLSVCEKCHNSLHHQTSDTKKQRKKTTNGYFLI